MSSRRTIRLDTIGVDDHGRQERGDRHRRRDRRLEGRGQRDERERGRRDPGDRRFALRTVQARTGWRPRPRRRRRSAEEDGSRLRYATPAKSLENADRDRDDRDQPDQADEDRRTGGGDGRLRTGRARPIGGRGVMSAQAGTDRAVPSSPDRRRTPTHHRAVPGLPAHPVGPAGPARGLHSGRDPDRPRPPMRLAHVRERNAPSNTRMQPVDEREWRIASRAGR